MREGRLKASVPELAEFLTRWNLRGLGVAEREIGKAVAAAKRFLAQQIKLQTSRIL